VASQPGITNHVAATVTGTIWAKAARALSRKYLSRSFFRAVIKDMPSQNPGTPALNLWQFQATRLQFVGMN
jgi:hypothetical protein